MTLAASIRKKIVEFIPNSIRKELESRYYSDVIFQADNYISYMASIEDDGVSYKLVGSCHVFSMGTQDNMIAYGWLRETCPDEYRDESILDDWLKENMTGFYTTRGWGNGRANYGQSHYGLWHVEVYIMRDVDAMAFRLYWM